MLRWIRPTQLAGYKPTCLAFLSSLGKRLVRNHTCDCRRQKSKQLLLNEGEYILGYWPTNLHAMTRSRDVDTFLSVWDLISTYKTSIASSEIRRRYRQDHLSTCLQGLIPPHMRVLVLIHTHVIQPLIRPSSNFRKSGQFSLV